MKHKVLFTVGTFLLFGICGGLECDSLSIGQALLCLLLVMPVTLYCFLQSDWYEPADKRKRPYRCGNIK